MGSSRRITALACAALIFTPAAHALRPPSVTWLGTPKNFTHADRPPSAIRLIVIHATEGPFAGSVTWLRNPASHASANFVVSRSGEIVELVSKRDIAWHAGNWRVNLESVGIEHVGITGSPAGFTEAEYRSSARLVAYIARSSLIPIDRTHIIGHAQVPDPSDPLQGGGIDNHTDPGPYWNWPHYLKLVRTFAYPRPPRPPVRLGIGSTTLYDGQIVAGTVPWRAHVRGPVTRVDFLVDGKLVRSDRRTPFALVGGWRTRRLGNGNHVLELRAYSRARHWTRDRIVVRVRNLPFLLRASGVRSHGSAAGLVTVNALLTGGRPRLVQLWLDGREIDHDARAPYAFRWDSHLVSNGPHVLQLRAIAVDGRAAELVLPVLVANAGVALPSPEDGSTVQGVVPLQPAVSGSGVRAVDFLVDGVVRGTATAPPWTFSWDTTRESPGPHVLTARARGASGPEGVASVGVVVAAG